MLKISTNPHMQTFRNTRAIMLDVIIALIPAALAAVLFFGIDALRVILTSVAACVIFEWIACKYWLKTKNTTTDLSAVITGLLLAFNLPAEMPCWMILIGSFISIIIAKVCFGGIGQNFANPAITARIFMLISFKNENSDNFSLLYQKFPQKSIYSEEYFEKAAKSIRAISHGMQKDLHRIFPCRSLV